MRLELTGRHVIITPALRASVERRLARLARKLNDSILSVQVVLTKEDTRHRAEATLHTRGDRLLHSDATNRSAKASLDAALEKIQHQADTLKGKRASRQRRQLPQQGTASGGRPGGDTARLGPAGERDMERPVRIVRARRYEVKPMSVDDAALEVGHIESAFVVFRNAGTDTINVLFRRSDGNLGLIEPED